MKNAAIAETIKQPTGLVRYDTMCSAIAACHRVDEAKDIRDQARAMEVYAQVALNTEAERKAIEIRIRAERRAGELLKLAKEAGQRHSENGTAHRPSKKVSNGATPSRPTLAEIGITRDQSSDWQKLAEIPKEKFEEALAAPYRKPSTEGILQSTGKVPPAPKIHFDRDALRAYGHVRQFEEIMERPASELFALMQDFQQEHICTRRRFGRSVMHVSGAGFLSVSRLAALRDSNDHHT